MKGEMERGVERMEGEEGGAEQQSEREIQGAADVYLSVRPRCYTNLTIQPD